MMNVLALSLVASALVAGVWSPNPQRDDVIVKEGHRVVVVEYDEDGKHNTKVSISSPSINQDTEPGGYFDEETGSALPNYGHRISHGKDATPGELVCDAFGKCTQKYVNAYGAAKDTVSGAAHEAKEKVSETTHDVKDKVSETAQGVGQKISETAHGTKDRAVETAHQTKNAVGDALGKAKEAVMRKGQDAKDKAKDTLKTAKDTSQTIGGDVLSNVTEEVANVQGKVKTGANKVLDGLKYMFSMDALNTVMGTANLLGLATAYGMSVWVTFISSYVLAQHLPRLQFGVLQSKIYPVYFRAMCYSIGLALFAHLLWHGKRSITSLPEIFQAFNLLSSLFMVLFNALYLEPKATKVMFERMKMEKEEGRGRPDFTAEGSRVTESPSVADPAAKRTRTGPSPATTTVPTSSEEEVTRSRMSRLNERLKKLNTNSSMLNILTLMSLSWHLVYLGQRLTFKC